MVELWAQQAGLCFLDLTGVVKCGLGGWHLVSPHKELMPLRAQRDQHTHCVPDSWEGQGWVELPDGSAPCYRGSGVKVVWLVQGANRARRGSQMVWAKVGVLIMRRRLSFPRYNANCTAGQLVGRDKGEEASGLFLPKFLTLKDIMAPLWEKNRTQITLGYLLTLIYVLTIFCYVRSYSKELYGFPVLWVRNLDRDSCLCSSKWLLIGVCDSNMLPWNSRPDTLFTLVWLN